VNPALDLGLYKLKTLKRMRRFQTDVEGHKGGINELTWMLDAGGI
jgi:hypothetical protein